MKPSYVADIRLSIESFTAEDYESAKRIVDEYISALAAVPGLTWADIEDETLEVECA